MCVHTDADPEERSDFRFFCWASVWINSSRVISAVIKSIFGSQIQRSSPFSSHLSGQLLPQPSPPDVHKHKNADCTISPLYSHSQYWDHYNLSDGELHLNIPCACRFPLFSPAAFFHYNLRRQSKHKRTENKTIRRCSPKAFSSWEIQAYKNLLIRPLRGSPRCFFNNYSVHCCGHIMQGRCYTRNNADSVAIAVVFCLK